MTEVDDPGAPGLAARRRRLRFRAWHRGMREMDLIMGPFADAEAQTMAEADLAAFERLMEEPDPDLFARFAAGGDAPPGADPALWRRIGAFHAARKPVHS